MDINARWRGVFIIMLPSLALQNIDYFAIANYQSIRFVNPTRCKKQFTRLITVHILGLIIAVGTLKAMKLGWSSKHKRKHHSKIINVWSQTKQHSSTFVS
jgi:cytochrome b subunit of formate dehydrogenase